jgi:hypothetical protein
MCHIRKFSVALVLVLALAVAVSTASAASATTGHSRAAVVAPDTRQSVPAHAAGIGSFIWVLVRHAVYRASQVISRRVGTSVVRRYAWSWTRAQAVYWFCHRYDAYLGRSTWYWAAHYYYYPNWAWNVCARYGYFG